MKKTLLTFLLVSPLLLISHISSARPEPATAPLPAIAHAHNDYQHDHPLWDALHFGFSSIEVDVRLVGGIFFVAHDAEDVRPFKTLSSLYLDPLRKLIKENNGSVYRDGSGIVLMIDVKTEGSEAWPPLLKLLEQYMDLESGSVEILVSGKRDLNGMVAANNMWIRYDGRLDDLQMHPNLPLISLISAKWTDEFAWNGHGAIPETDLIKMKKVVALAHNQGRKIRFWATDFNDSDIQKKVWNQLLAEGVDYICTDKLGEFRNFMSEQSNTTIKKGPTTR